MVTGEKLFLISFGCIKGNIFHLIGAPNVLRQGNDNLVPFFLECSTICQHGIILLFIRFIPRDIPLCRKEGRQDITDIGRCLHCRTEAHLGKIFFCRHIDSTIFIGRIHKITTHGERNTAEETDHANALILENLQQLFDRLRMDEENVVIDIDFNLGNDVRQDFVDLCRIGLLSIDCKYFHFIAVGPLHILESFNANFVLPRMAVPQEHRDLLFTRQVTLMHRLVCTYTALQQTANLLHRHDLIHLRHMPFF